MFKTNASQLIQMTFHEALRALGLREGASREEIRNAYFELSRRYHPDMQNHDGEYQKRLNAAYSFLKQAANEARGGQRHQDSEQQSRYYHYHGYHQGSQEHSRQRTSADEFWAQHGYSFLLLMMAASIATLLYNLHKLQGKRIINLRRARQMARDRIKDQWREYSASEERVQDLEKLEEWMQDNRLQERLLRSRRAVQPDGEIHFRSPVVRKQHLQPSPTIVKLQPVAERAAEPAVVST
eukprot:NODE_3571_length_951_cov_46.651885_g3281_i0.p1 GENE.NODE_3571_length_951_cov_46.651885_g3281_i0~~NODE_3571_length_951_cov_46.651885_g3281_i0.p1  ORF type:complete len:239 (+),score=31.15 NODE_3571_length_951_cov_46.651885_g3281_i0:232-948(+)